ncbi:hypothetical protein [Mucilaginibacter sp. UYCu711]|uniref:hypothetical protein n=1 Tax=Mucilaginibacter sp. UYCu711 TaxID=3156339 RepID=UPI003D255F7B
MKFKFLIALCLLVSTSFAQKTTNSVKSDATSVSLTEDHNSYELSAKYNEELTDKVNKCLDEGLAKGTDFSFKNTRLDAVMTLDNGVTFYAKNSPGKLILKLDKRKNSTELYNRFKKMCEEVSAIVQKK